MSRGVSLHSDQRFRALIEHSNDAIALLSAEGSVTYASPSTERVTGYTAEELVGMNGFALLHPEDLEDVRQQFTTLLNRPGHSITVEYRICHKNGAWRWMEGTATNLLLDPTIQAIVVNFRDITERKQAEEERRQLLARGQAARAEAEEERARMYELFMQAPAMITVLGGPEHRFKFAKWARDRADLVGKTAREGFPASVAQEVIAILDEVYTTGRAIVGTEVRRQIDRRGDGVLEEAYYNFVYQPTRTAQGEVDGVLIHSVEVTEQVQARRRVEELNRQLEGEKDALRQAKQEAEARAAELSATFEAMTDGVAVCDARGDFRYTNAAYRSLLALEANADPSVLQFDHRLEWLALRDVEGRPLPREQLASQRVLRGEHFLGTYAMDFQCCTREGATIILNVSGAPIRDAAGQVVGGVMVFRDMTTRRRLEQQLQYSERKLRSLVESNILGVAVSDSAGRIHEVNDQFAQLVGYSKEELLSGAVIKDQLIPVDYREALAQHEAILLATGAMPPWEKECLRKDGSRVPTLMAGALLDQERGLALVLFHDISERKEVERRKEEFLSMVSHELRTPLTVILGLIELALQHIELRPSSLAPEAEGLINRIEGVLKRASGQVEIEARLVEELLDVSRLEMHKFELSLQRENLVTIVQETVANQQQAAPTRDIELVLPPDELVPVIVDAGRIGQVLTNYLTNALKYAPVEQMVSVHLEVEARVARVSVRDQGPGLTPEQQQRVWERFYQAAAPGLRGPDRGLGLGLAIAKAIIEQHQGQVGVESAPGRGSTFWFTVPLTTTPLRSN